MQVLPPIRLPAHDPARGAVVQMDVFVDHERYANKQQASIFYRERISGRRG
jgi:hypothetical protein